MKSFRVAVLIAAGSFAAFSVAQNAPPGGAVEGTVVNSATGAGIAGASVIFLGRQSTRYEATSDAMGHFKIAGMIPGSYRTDVKAAQPDLSLLSSSGLRVGSGSDPVKMELKLTPVGAIIGRVLSPDGKPAAGVEVRVYPDLMAKAAATNEEGRFAFGKIRPGSYTLIAMPPKGAKPEEARDGTRTAIVPTYYPSAADRSLAQPIVFRGQGDFGGDYEIRMQTAPVHRVRGIVLDEEGKPSPGAELTVLPVSEGPPAPMGLSMRAGGLSVFALGMRTAPTGLPEATAIAGKDGHFEFPAVRSGDWRINVVSHPTRDVFSRGIADALVGRGDVDDLQVRVAWPFNLTGTVEWRDGDPGNRRFSEPRLPSPLTLISPDGNEFITGGIVGSGRLLFERLLPGRYQAIVEPGLSAQIFVGESEVTGQAFSVAAGGPKLRVVLKTWSGGVRGTVEKGDGATVVLVPQRVEGAALGQTVVCGAGGSFELSEVSPGDYYIAAFDHMDGPAPSAAMLSLVASRGTSVKVEEHSAASVVLSVMEAPR